jgi:hypothetical protein
MLAHSIKHILELVPEALPLIKSASVDQDYPLDNRGSAIASALELKYHEVVDHKSIDPFSIEKVARAVDLYGATDEVKDLTTKLIKAAQANVAANAESKTDVYLSKQAGFEGDLTGLRDLPALAQTASELYKQASELNITPSETVKRYAGQGYLDKKASVESLAARYQASKNVNFVKIASALYRMDESTMKPETVFDVCKTVAEMDKEAGLSALGFDFFREAVIVKTAASAMTINLCGKPYPYESLARLGKDRIAQFIGKDVADEFDAGPQNAKAVIETLPADLQQILVNLLKNV